MTHNSSKTMVTAYKSFTADQANKNEKETEKVEKRGSKCLNERITTLKLLSDKCTAQNKRAVESLKILVRVVTTLGKKLKDFLHYLDRSIRRK